MAISNDVTTICGVRGYIDENNIAQLNLEDIARGLGFVEVKGNYIRWQRVEKYLNEFKFSTCGERPEFVPENIFYRLAMKAKNEVAEKFQAIVADEILPTIRKHGAYMTTDVIQKALSSPDFLIELATNLKQEQEKNKMLNNQIEEQKPLVGFAEQVLKADDNILVRELAKTISDQVSPIGQNKLYQKLREWKLIMPDKTEPYQTAIDRGYFVVEEVPIKTPYGNRISFTTKVTPKGQVSIVERYRKEAESNNE